MRRSRRSEDAGGYVAILMSILMLLLFSMSAFAVDVGNWYFTGQRLQKAADAGALAGVPYLPATPDQAFDIAADNVANNGFRDPAYLDAGEEANAEVTTELAGSPTRLRVTVASTVDNAFGALLGVSQATIVRTAVADYAGPVPLGSPCNKFGQDPEAEDANTGAQCENVTGQFWTNVGSLAAPKVSGDAYQNGVCPGGVDGCTGATNDDYAPDGYFYSVTLAEPVSNLVLQAFDPALINVGDTCTTNMNNATANARNTAPGVTNWPIRYEDGPASPYCTGDIRFGGTGEVTTEFTARQPVVTTNAWDPLSYEPISTATCSPKTYPGYNGNLLPVLDDTNNTYNPYVASVFRTWQTLCTIPYAPAGTYMIQVKTNGLGTDAASGHNRFALRAYSGTDSTAADSISISGHSKMAIYANLPSAQTEFYLARLPSGAAGQVFTIKLFDIGDSSKPGLITVKAPVDSGVTFSDCKGKGVGVVVNCSMVASGAFNGKWQSISLVVPEAYTCEDTDANACWVTLQYDYGVGSAPSDTTSWTASLDGDPVRLIE